MRVGGNEWAKPPSVVEIETLNRDVVGVSVRRLDFMKVKPGGEEKHGFSAGGNQGFVHIGRHTAASCQDPQGGGFEQCEVPVSAPHPQDWLDRQRIPLVVDEGSIMHSPYFKPIRSIDEFGTLPEPVP